MIILSGLFSNGIKGDIIFRHTTFFIFFLISYLIQLFKISIIGTICLGNILFFLNHNISSTVCVCQEKLLGLSFQRSFPFFTNTHTEPIAFQQLCSWPKIERPAFSPATISSSVTNLIAVPTYWLRINQSSYHIVLCLYDANDSSHGNRPTNAIHASGFDP